MRFSDLIKLAVSALWQQKLRTTLTTLGVVFGSFVLIASLSVRIGVNERILQEYARFRELREIRVSPTTRTGEKPPEKKLDVQGKMSEAKRRRLREDRRRWWQRQSTNQAQLRLTSDRLSELRRLPHVRAVRAQLFTYGRAVLGKDAEYVQALSATANDERFPKRLVAGAYFTSDTAREILVSEHLLYRLGIADDADVKKTIGKTLRFEIHRGRPSPGLLVALLSGRHSQTKAGDEEFLGKIVKQLPKAVEKLDLTPDEQSRLSLLLKPPADKKENPIANIAGEFRIVGVMRSPLPEKPRRRTSWLEQSAELLIPADAMAKLLFQVEELRERGFENVVVEVDEVDNVKAVTDQIASTGLSAQSPIRAIEHQQTIYSLIFSAMTVVAFIALLVAALGITNTMIMSVLERVRQIGIMKAVGARNGQIQAIFLIEGALIGFFGGTLGMLLAYAASVPGDAWVQSMLQGDLSIELHGSIFAFPWSLMLGVPCFATLITTISAFFPARRAARVDPVSALRTG